MILQLIRRYGRLICDFTISINSIIEERILYPCLIGHSIGLSLLHFADCPYFLRRIKRTGIHRHIIKTSNILCTFCKNIRYSYTSNRLRIIRRSGYCNLIFDVVSFFILLNGVSRIHFCLFDTDTFLFHNHIRFKRNLYSYVRTKYDIRLTADLAGIKATLHKEAAVLQITVVFCQIIRIQNNSHFTICIKV